MPLKLACNEVSTRERTPGTNRTARVASGNCTEVQEETETMPPLLRSTAWPSPAGGRAILESQMRMKWIGLGRTLRVDAAAGRDGLRSWCEKCRLRGFSAPYGHRLQF
jgi:hypothetical protein